MKKKGGSVLSWANKAVTFGSLAVFVVIGTHYLRSCRAIAIEKGEADVVTHLVLFRSALFTQYGHDPKKYPLDLGSLNEPKSGVPGPWEVYFDNGLPPAPRKPDVPHPSTEEIEYFESFLPKDTGKWGYVNNPKDAGFGTLFIDCTHTDSNGRNWSLF